MIKKIIIILPTLCFMVSAYAGDHLTGFDVKKDLPVLNERLRKIDRSLLYGRLRTSASDSSMGYLDTKILNITVIGSVTDGEIAGWTISNTSLSSGTGGTTVGLDSGGTNPAIYCGSATPASAPFRVTNAGAMTATSGSIGGWSIGGSGLSGGSLEDYIGLVPGQGIFMGNETFADAEFSVTNAGVLKATSGTIGGWILGSTYLTDNATTANANVLIDKTNALIRLGPTTSEYITIDGVNQRLRTSDYTTGASGSGWNIDTSVAEFQNIRARGKITTSVFEKETISSIGGNFLVSDSDILNADMTALDASTMTISGDTTFAVGDFLRIKDGVDDEWFEVTNAGSAPTYTVTRDKAGDYAANTNPIWKKGTAVVNYGASGEGIIFMTASEGNAPFIDFITHAGSPWTTTTVKTRLGKLDGVPGCSGYGIYGGDGYLGALDVIDIISIGSSGEIRSNTAGNYPYLSFSNSGLMLKDSDTGGTYGTAVYGTDKYGAGAAVWIMNSDIKIPWLEQKEPNAGASDVASIRLYNRSDNPGGKAEVGDLAVVNGKLKICTGAGTPGTWTVVGAQTA